MISTKLSKISKPNLARRALPCIFQKQKMSIDVILSRTENPSLNNYKPNYFNPTIENNHLKSHDFQLPNKDPNQILSKIQSYELNSQYTPQIIISKYSNEHDNEEDKLLNDKQRYQLIHYIATLKTPYISIIDTTIDGFNASTSILGGFKVVTENTRVRLSRSFGTSFYLSRLDGNLGLYLLMTGSCLTGKELLFSGLATHYMHSSKLNQVEDELSQLNNLDTESVNQVLNKFSKGYNDDNEVPFGGYRRTVIDNCFKYDTVNKILEALEMDGSTFAQTTHHVIQSQPKASAILEEFRYARAALGFSDYLIKENHNQDPSFLNNNDFSCLNRSYLLPFEKDVKRYIEDKLFFGDEDVLKHFGNKYGVREKVQDIIERKTKRVQVGEVSKLVWCDE